MLRREAFSVADRCRFAFVDMSDTSYVLACKRQLCKRCGAALGFRIAARAYQRIRPKPREALVKPAFCETLCPPQLTVTSSPSRSDGEEKMML